MLRAMFVLGAMAICVVGIVSCLVAPLLWWAGVDALTIASAVVWVMLLTWIAAMVGVAGLRLVRALRALTRPA